MFSCLQNSVSLGDVLRGPQIAKILLVPCLAGWDW
jgi:hypothetical protein